MLGGEPPHLHEEYAIIALEPVPQHEEIHEALQEVIAHLEHLHPVRIISSSISPLGLGLVQFQNTIQRESMINLSPIPFGSLSLIHIQRHDEGINSKTCNYSRVCWIVFLSFPLDFQSMDYVKAVMAPFG